jgi:hypothetical protein
VQNFIIAACVSTGAGTLLDKSTFVAGKEKDLLGFPYRIIC